MDAVVEARELVKNYGALQAVDGISFHIAPRQCFGFLGPNGAGKTTTMRMLYGRVMRSGGALRVLDMDPSTQSRAIRERIGVVPQTNNLDGDLSVLENLRCSRDSSGSAGARPGSAPSVSSSSSSCRPVPRAGCGS
jgi:lipooligosaccharide transport system ATP-binding protein